MKQSISWVRILNAGMIHVITALEQCPPCQLGMQVWLWTTGAINHAWNEAKDVPEKGAEAQGWTRHKEDSIGNMNQMRSFTWQTLRDTGGEEFPSQESPNSPKCKGMWLFNSLHLSCTLYFCCIQKTPWIAPVQPAWVCQKISHHLRFLLQAWHSHWAVPLSALCLQCFQPWGGGWEKAEGKGSESGTKHPHKAGLPCLWNHRCWGQKGKQGNVGLVARIDHLLKWTSEFYLCQTVQS